MAEENAKFEWNAKQYSKFVKDRTLPSIDLAKAIDLPGAKAALDIGCGIGNSTAVLAKAFPGARVIGADNSADMLDSAKKNHPDLEFIKLDAQNEIENIDKRFDIVFSNACIQWIPNHHKLLKDMFSLLNPGGVLAVQIPQQRKHPVHTIMRSLAETEKWREKIKTKRIFYILSEEEYFDELARLTDDFRMWEVIYFHAMPSHESIVEWYKGTGLRPYLSQLNKADQAEFLKDFSVLVKEEYPVRENGKIIFRFPRLFFTAKKK